MILLESGKASYFNPKKVGVSMYDDMMDNPNYYKNIKNKIFEVVWMTPMEYINKCADGFKSTNDRLIKSRTNKYSDKYADMMSRGTKFNMLYLDYSGSKGFSQEGLHRAVAAMSIDPDKKIPVMVVTDWKSKKDFRVPLIYDGKGNVRVYSDES